MLHGFALVLALTAGISRADEAPAEVDGDAALLLDWRRGRLRLRIDAPAGRHLAPEAPADLSLAVDEQQLALHSHGAALEGGLLVALPGSSPWELEGELSFSLCHDDGSACQSTGLAFLGQLEGRRGAARWLDHEPELAASEPAAQGSDPQQALDLAAQDGRPLLLDFGARWCPPCNQLAAEVLHAPAHAATLERFHLVVVDADKPESWPWKDRYHVGGYPTVVAADSQGLELGRQEGYPGEEAFLAWLDQVATQGTSLERRLEQLREGELATAQRGALALDLVRAQRQDEAREALHEAAQDYGSQLAALLLDGDPQALAWLAGHADQRVISWFHDARDAILADPQLVETLRRALRRELATAEPSMGAELTDVLAELAPEGEAAGYRAAAAALLRQALTGDSEHDRGHWSSLAWLLKEAGQLDAALQVLQLGIEAFPQDFTFHYARARYLLEGERPAEALPAAQQALEFAYGDMRLRAAVVLAKALRELDRPQEASQLLQTELDAFARPAADLQVRSHRYLKAAEELLLELGG